MNSSLSYNEVRVQGLLVDNQELYAQNLELELAPQGVSGGRLIAEATVNSPRPVIVKTQTSSDLGVFTNNATEQKERQVDATKWTVSTAADGEKKFLTASATARESK